MPGPHVTSLKSLGESTMAWGLREEEEEEEEGALPHTDVNLPWLAGSSA